MSTQEGSPNAGGHLFAGYPGRVLTLVALGTMMTGSSRLLVAPLLPAIQTSLGLSTAVAGLSVSVMWVLGGFNRYIGGRLADQLSRKTILVGGLGISSLGCALVSVAHSFPTFLLGAALIGTGVGLYFPAGMAQLGDLFVERRGQAIGVNNGSLNLGGVIVSVFAATIVAMATWRDAFLPVTAFGLFILALTHFVNDGPYTVQSVDFGIRATASRLFDIREIRLALVAYVLLAFVWQGIANFLPTYLQFVGGLSPSIASGAFAVFFVVGIASNPLAGRLGDRVGYARVAMGLSLVAAIGLTLFLLAAGLAMLVVGYLLLSVGLTGFWSVMGAYMLSHFPDASMGGDFGAVGSIYLGVGSLGPTYVGVLAERFSFGVAFAGFLPCLLVSAAIMYYLGQDAPA